MGRINLAALRVRQKALALVKTGRGSGSDVSPVWTDIMAETPPAQILIRQQPLAHARTETRTTLLPDGRPKQNTRTIAPRQSAKARKPKHMYQPNQLRYEEDALRNQFFADHPWELARPRMLVETNGNQHAHADWSTGIEQPGLQVSGESVAQRQLWLLENTPNITLSQAYDTARKEFYAIRRRQQIQQRIALEEAENNGVEFGPSSMSVGMTKESAVFDEWMIWAEGQNMALVQRQASFAGTQPGAETTGSGANNATTQRSVGADPSRAQQLGQIGSAFGRPVTQSAQDIFARQRAQQPVREIN